jgi:uncharacterized protein (DUF697 family)
VVKLPLNLSKSLKAFKDASVGATEPASVVLAGDPALVEAAKERFAEGGMIPASLADTSAASLAAVVSAPDELLVVLTTPDKEAGVEASLGYSLARGSVIVAVDEGPGVKARASYLANGASRLSFSSASPGGWSRLFSLCAEAAGDRGVALARRYPVVRQAAARRLVWKTAAQNVFIALVFFVPGSDMPAMTLNQARMVLNLAAMYGQQIDKERAVEIAGVVVLGYGFRGIGRLLVRSVPGLSLVMRVVTAYSATMAVGLGAMAYFEKGAPASTSKVVALAGSLRR